MITFHFPLKCGSSTTDKSNPYNKCGSCSLIVDILDSAVRLLFQRSSMPSCSNIVVRTTPPQMMLG
jgi:hypothetical protein